MSWLYSRALVEAFSVATCSGGEPYAPLRATPTPQAFCSLVRMTAFSRLSRFGMTFAPLTASNGADVLTWYLAGFPVKTSALPVKEQALKAPGLASGRTWPGLLATFDRSTFSWRTAQRSLLGDSGELSVIWPRSGMTVDGKCYPLPMLVRRTCENGFGLSPLGATLCARDYKHPGRSRLARTGGKQGECLPQQIGGPLNPVWCEWYMGFPLGWTEFAPLAMPKFQQWQQQHGDF